MRRISVLLCLLPLITQANALTADELLNACEPIVARNMRPSLAPSEQTCLGYFGALQDLATIADNTGGSILVVCLPPASTVGQLIRVFVQYARAHPQHLHYSGGGIALASFQQAFPCNAR